MIVTILGQHLVNFLFRKTLPTPPPPPPPPPPPFPIFCHALQVITCAPHPLTRINPLTFY